MHITSFPGTKDRLFYMDAFQFNSRIFVIRIAESCDRIKHPCSKNNYLLK